LILNTSGYTIQEGQTHYDEEEGAHWITAVILPRNFQPPLKLKNPIIDMDPKPQKIFIIDSLGIERDVLRSRLIKYLLEGIDDRQTLEKYQHVLNKDAEIHMNGLACLSFFN